MKGIATGIGSLPYSSYRFAVRAVLKYAPAAPYWPELPNSSRGDQMIRRSLRGAPIELGRKMGGVWCYRLASGRPPAIPAVPGLDLFVREAAPGRAWVKGQMTGPLTLGLCLVDAAGTPLLFNPQAFRALEGWVLDSARLVAGKLSGPGRRALIFFDEPVLGLEPGKAALAARRAWYRDFLTSVRSRGVIVGIHCCSDFSWDDVLAVDPGAVSFDAFRHAGSFLKTSKRIASYVSRGGILAFGVVPSGDTVRGMTDTDLRDTLASLLERLGTDPGTFFITPSCGLGTLDGDLADEIMRRTRLLSERF